MDTTTDANAKLITEARERAHGLQFEVDYQTMRALADTLEAVTTERDNALVREDLAVKVFQREQDNVIALQSQIKAVTKERYALRRQVAAYRDTHGCEKDDICNLCKEVDDNAK